MAPLAGRDYTTQRKPNKFLKNLPLTMFALPGFIWFVVFSYLPMFGIVLAFKNFKIHSKNFFESLYLSEWSGFKNFEFFFKSKDAWKVTRNTIFYNLTFIILNIVVPLLVAIMLHEMLNQRAAKSYQTAIFLPYFLSWVVISYSVYALLATDRGVVNQLIGLFGIEKQNWYREEGVWPFILTALSTWKMLGYNTVVYLASLAGIDRSYYEAASIDGASKWQQFKYITLPSLKPVITILFVLALGGIFRADFGLFFHIPRNSHALLNVTEVIDTYVYKLLIMDGNLQLSSAISLFQSAVGFVLILGANRLVRHFDPERAIY